VFWRELQRSEPCPELERCKVVILLLSYLISPFGRYRILMDHEEWLWIIVNIIAQ
jgi:hypothetical protein